jgi:hypothetical protein
MSLTREPVVGGKLREEITTARKHIINMMLGGGSKSFSSFCMMRLQSKKLQTSLWNKQSAQWGSGIASKSFKTDGW